MQRDQWRSAGSMEVVSCGVVRRGEARWWNARYASPTARRGVRRACVRMCVCAYVRACVRACVS
jgi:hypothetical protein